MATQEHHAYHAPEVVNSDFPEAVAPQQYQQYHYNQYQQYPSHTSLKPDDGLGQYPPASAGAPFSAYSGSQLDPASPKPHHAVPGAAPAPAAGKRKGTIFGCGCSALVVVLCLIIALLSAAVIGLAAGVGVQSSRANTALRSAEQLSASLASATSAPAATATAGSPTATSTSFAALDNNCTDDPAGVTGTTYDAFSLFGNYSFTIQCNKDAPGGPLMSLFASDFNTCMDHCAAYSNFLPKLFGSSNTNATCGGVSFIPLWTTKASALKGSAPGNCFLKPTQDGTLDTPNIGTECHAAVLNAK